MFIIAHNAAHIWGGAERATSLLLAGLQARGHRVLLLCREELVARRAGELGVETRIVPLGGDGALHHAVRLAAVLRESRPDAFIVGTFRKLFLAALGARLARVPRVVARVGLETDTPRRAKYRLVLPRWIDAVVVNATRIRASFDALPGLGPERVFVIHNGVVPPERRQAPGAVRAQLGIAPDAPVVGAVARLAAQKRLDRLLRAVAALPAEVHCVVAGEGEERASLAALAEELGIAGRVHLLGHRDDTGDVLGALDLFVVSSDREGLSNAMLEALAAGIPIISTAVSGADDALEPFAGGAAPGIIVAAADEELARAIGGLLADRGLRGRMAEAGRRRAAERFGVEAMLDRWEAVLKP